MTERELREIKRRFRPEKSNIPKIVGCFVNGAGVIISKISQPIGLTSDNILSEKLLGVMKKTLSGTLGSNLADISFSTKQVTESDEHSLLMTLVKSRLSDEEALDKLYTRITESVKFESNYVILLASDVYDVVSHSADALGESLESSEQFSYIVCAVCPVKSMPEALSFKEADSLFHTVTASALLSSVDLGFMFPAFDDRKTNIYNALYYTRDLAASYPEFTERIFGCESPMPPKLQQSTFGGCLAGALSEECSLDVVREVHSQIAEMIESHKESRDPEPLMITKETVKSVLRSSGVDEEKVEKLGETMDECFGVNAELAPKNIVKVRQFEVKTPEVTVKVSPEHRDLVTTQTVNGVKYVMIRVDGGVEVNGINVSIED